MPAVRSNPLKANSTSSWDLRTTSAQLPASVERFQYLQPDVRPADVIFSQSGIAHGFPPNLEAQQQIRIRAGRGVATRPGAEQSHRLQLRTEAG
jgi:hypothetical protein